MSSTYHRIFLTVTLAIGVGAAADITRAQVPVNPAPNILLILAEDIGPQLSCYGEPLVGTPHLDALAARGVRYTHAFTTAPVCSASRSALMTGMYQTTIGAHNHRTWQWHKQPLPPGGRTLTDYLRGAGYFTCNLSPGEKDRDPKTGERLPTGSKGSGKTDFNFRLERPFDGHDWIQRAAGQPFFAQIRSWKATKATAGHSRAKPSATAASIPPK